MTYQMTAEQVLLATSYLNLETRKNRDEADVG